MAVCLSCYFVNYVMVFFICYWSNHTQGKMKLSRKSENAVADDQVLKFLYDATYVMLNPQCDVTRNTRMVA